MHITGKLLIFVLFIPLAAVSIWMSARLYVVRNSWAKDVTELADKNNEAAKQIDINQKKIKMLKDDLARTMVPWDRYWNDVVSRGTVDQGKLTLNATFGSNSGVNSRVADPVVHAFSQDAKGQYSYLGPFRATTVQQQNAALIPTWIYRASDKLELSQSKWRFRSMIPDSYTNRIDYLSNQLKTADVNLRDQNIVVAKQAELITSSDNLLNKRLGELLGDPGAKVIPGRPEFSKGLASAIEEEQTSRNKVLEQLDARRRELKAEYDKMIKLINENKQMASQLAGNPQPAVKATAQKSQAGKN